MVMLEECQPLRIRSRSRGGPYRESEGFIVCAGQRSDRVG